MSSTSPTCSSAPGVEALTDKIEAEAEKIFDRILTLGGSDLTSKDTEKLAETVRASGPA